MKNSRRAIVERQNRILEYLKTHNHASVQDISAALGASPATIRRDIVALKKSGDVQKELGSASLSLQVKPGFDDVRYQMTNVSEKEAIAQQAAKLIQDGDTVFMNASSTAQRILKYLGDKHVNIITNNVRSLTEQRGAHTELIITGGEAGNQGGETAKLSLTGEYALDTIGKITATKCILGVSGISAEGGLTSIAVKEPPVNRAMMRRCTGDIIIVVDHRKIGVTHNFHFAGISDVTCVVTDSGSDINELESIRMQDVDVIVVHAEKE